MKFNKSIPGNTTLFIGTIAITLLISSFIEGKRPDPFIWITACSCFLLTPIIVIIHSCYKDRKFYKFNELIKKHILHDALLQVSFFIPSTGLGLVIISIFVWNFTWITLPVGISLIIIYAVVTFFVIKFRNK